MQVTSLLSSGWAGLLSGLPASLDLTALARERGAIVRSRRVSDGETLLRLALWYGPGGMSLRSAAALATGTQTAELSDVALLKRLCGAADWLEAIVSAMLIPGQTTQTINPMDASRPLVLIDGTALSQQGSHGTNWVLHSRYRPDTGFTGFTLTDCHGGETLTRHTINPGEIVVADRAYGRTKGLRHVLDHNADFVVRVGWRSLAWRNQHGEVLDLLALLETVQPGEAGAFVVHAALGKDLLPVRLVVEARDEHGAKAAIRKVKQKATKNGRIGDPRSCQAARYMIIATSLDAHDYPPARIIELYRLRWQIELAFKRLKSLVHLGRVPAKNARLARTWLYAHLLFALLTDAMTQQVLDSPPCA